MTGPVASASVVDEPVVTSRPGGTGRVARGQGAVVAAYRLLGVVITLFLSSALIFFLLHLGGGDPTTRLAGDPEDRTPERLAQVRTQFGLDHSLVVQYLDWLRGAITGDFGISYTYRLPVSTLVGSRLITTLSLAAFATVLFVVIGGVLGVIAARAQGRPVDSLITGVTILAASVPSFVIGLVLIILLGLQWKLLPVGGAGQGFGGRLQHLVLPALALAGGGVATLSRVTRQTSLEALHSDHLESAQANGLRTLTLVRRHVVRNSLTSILTMSGLQFASLIAGTVVIEQVFGLSGIGSLLIEGINANDYPVVQSVLLLMVLIYVVVTTVVDIINRFIDPRLRQQVAR